jgi:hypothetical protein
MKAILFVTQDVGPAKYLVHIINALKVQSFYVGNSLTSPLFEQTNALPFIPAVHLQQVALIITGTPLDNSISCLDKQYLLLGKRCNILVISIIEHWSWYNQRFFYRDSYVYPDYIVVNDAIAYEQAVSDHVPEDLLVVLGNPHLEQVNNHSASSLTSAQFRQIISASPCSRLICFISEDLESCFPLASSCSLGYNEYTVLQDLINHLHPQDHLLIKLHPEEDHLKYQQFLSPNVSSVQHIGLSDLSFHVTVFVGMLSMLLIELSAHRYDIISYRPNSNSSFIGSTLNLVSSVTDVRELTAALTTPPILNNSLGSLFEGSLARILSFVYSHL